MKTDKNVALIEIRGSHDECLYSQILFLKSLNCSVHLICSADLKKQVEHFNEKDKTVFFDFKNAFVSDFMNLVKIRNYLTDNNIDMAVVNTATGTRIRNLLLLPFPETIKFTGIIHDTRKLYKSFTQKMISRRIKKYFVLNDYLLENLPPGIPVKTESFYPVYFSEFKKIDLHKTDNELWVCIPGQVEFKRRDYRGLLGRLKAERVNEKVKFILLGKSAHKYGNGGEIRNMIQQIGMQGGFVMFDDFVDDDLFYSYLSESDLVMPLIHPGREGFEGYSRYQISGSFNLAFGFKIPLLSEKYFEKYDDFGNCAFCYSAENLVSLLNRLSAEKAEIENKKARIMKTGKFDFEYQKKKYMEFLQS